MKTGEILLSLWLSNPTLFILSILEHFRFSLFVWVFVCVYFFMPFSCVPYFSDTNFVVSFILKEAVCSFHCKRERSQKVYGIMELFVNFIT